MSATRNVTYGNLFDRQLQQVIERLVAVSLGRAETFRQELFANFLERHMFICGACGREFEPMETHESEIVRCHICRR